MSTVPDGLYEYGGVPVGMAVLQPRDVRWVYATADTALHKKLLETTPDGNRLHTTVAAAHTATTASRNDVVFLTPETHNQTATITWSNSNTHLIGMHNGSRWANSCIIQNTSASTVVPVFTLSGSNCLIKNIHFKNAVGSNAANLTGVRVSGAGNLFENCWFEGPCDNSVADLATARTVQIGGGGNVFRDCVFGSTSVFRSAANALVEYYTTTYRATFENCIFYSQIDATTPYMIYIKSGKAQGSQFYKKCTFVAHSTGLAIAMASLFGAQTSDSTGMHLLHDCQAYNITSADDSDGANWPGLSIYWNNYTVTAATAGRGIVATG